MAFWDVPESDDPDLIAAIVAGQVERDGRGAAVYWAMRTLAGEQFIGVCDLSEIDRRHKRAEVGFMLGRDAWGQGYALEAMQAVMAYRRRQRPAPARWRAPTWATAARTACWRSSASRRKACCAATSLRDGERRDCRLFGLLL